MFVIFYQKAMRNIGKFSREQWTNFDKSFCLILVQYCAMMVLRHYVLGSLNENTSNWLTSNTTEHHPMLPQILPSIPYRCCSKAVADKVESISPVGRTRITGNQEPYELGYLNSNQPTVSSSLSIWKIIPSSPVNYYHIAWFSV